MIPILDWLAADIDRAGALAALPAILLLATAPGTPRPQRTDTPRSIP